AKWVWCLLTCALRSPQVELYTRTRVLRINDAGEHYNVITPRGTIRARQVINATESYTPLLHPFFHGVVRPTQTQAAIAVGPPAEMTSEVTISSSKGFFDRRGEIIVFGSDETRVADKRAGQNRPSRFITQFVLGEIRRHFGRFTTKLTHEWSGTVGFTPD